MSEHNITLKEKGRLILMCGCFRVELFCNTDFAEFCPICGDNLNIRKF